MYEAHFGLRALPFGSSPDPRFLCLLPQVKENLAALHYAIAARRGVVVMTGEVGTGKTTLLKAVLNTFTEAQISTVFLFNPRLDVPNFLEFVFYEFGIPIERQTKAGMLVQLRKWLMDRFAEGRLCVIVVDEAQDVSWELMEEIRLLTNMETPSSKLLQVVLSGQPELEERLLNPDIRQLLQRVNVWCKTQPLTSDQTPLYIAERLRIAGASAPIFNSAAIELVHQYSKGIPRLINVVCEHALICAFAEQKEAVSPEVIEHVVTTLNLKQHPPSLRGAPLARGRRLNQALQTFNAPVQDSEGTSEVIEP